MRILRYFSIFFVLGYAAWYFYAGDKPYQSISGQTMGTYYNVKIRTRKEDNMLPQKIRQRLDELNREMSVFDSESEISRLNNAKAGEWIDLSPEMSKVMKDSAKICRRLFSRKKEQRQHLHQSFRHCQRLRRRPHRQASGRRRLHGFRR